MRALKLIGTALIAALAASAAQAHDGAHHDAPGWSIEPWVVVPLLLAAVMFAVGIQALRHRSTHSDFTRRIGYFCAGWAILAGALVSPLHEMGSRSFSAHMIEHELIMVGAAPLLVLARPSVILLWGFPRQARRWVGGQVRGRGFRTLWRPATAPITATVVQAVLLWAWHAPALFDLALKSEVWHAAQHASFLISALLFWTAMLGRERMRPDGYALAALCLFATSLISGALGALMAFSDSPWYAPYAALGMTPYGLSPAEDQQVAGLIMWVPGGVVHAAAALAMIVHLLRRPPLAGSAAHAG